jgi:hypothetical protein
MLLNEQIERTFAQMKGLLSLSPKTVGFTDPSDVEIQVDFTAIDGLAVSVRELRFRSPRLTGRARAQAEPWAVELCRKLTYLLEPIGPVEFDDQAGALLLRSTIPHRHEGGVCYYELLLDASGLLTFKRFQCPRPSGQRQPIDLCLTREVFTRLVLDVVEAIGAA